MTLIDDDELRALLRDAGESFDEPVDARERILDEARAGMQRGGAVTSLRERLPRRRSARITLAAAAAVVVALAVSLPLVQLSPRPHASLQAGSVVPSTTVPGGFGSPVYSSSQSGAGYTQLQNGGQSLSTFVHGAAGTSKSDSSGTSGSTRSSASSLTAKVVSVGTVALAVRPGRIPAAVNELGALALHDGGFVSSTHVQIASGSGSGASSGTVVLRVPEAKYTALVAQVQRVGRVTSVQTNSTDVTGQYVDLQARIAALEASRAQYLAILAKAGSISDILAIQSQIDVIQTEIDQLEGQRNVLNNEAAYGTLTVTLGHTGHGSAAGSGITKAIHDSIRGFVLGVEWLIRIAGPVLFALLCLLALALLGRFAWRATRRRMI